MVRARISAAAASNILKQRYRELQEADSLDKLKSMVSRVKPSLGVRRKTVVVQMHPDDIAEMNTKKSVKSPGWLERISKFLVPVSVLQYLGSALGYSRPPKQEDGVKKLLADKKVRQKFLKSQIEKEVDKIRKLVDRMS